MLKLLKLRSQLKEIKNKLTDLRAKKAEFDRRNAELEKALDEAEGDDDLALVNQQIEELEKEEKEANVEQLPDLEAEATRIENEIKEIEDKTQTALGGGEGSTPPPAAPDNERNRKEVTNHMANKRTILGRMTVEQRTAFVQRDDIQEMLARVRELKQQNRAVTGAEIGIPTNALELIRENIEHYSKILKYVRLKTLRGNARQPILGDIPEGIWTESIANFNELDINFSEVTASSYKVGGYFAIPNSTMEDSDINLASELMEVIAEAIGKGVDKAIVYGIGKGMPLGIASRLAQTSKPESWDVNAPEWKNLSESNIITIDAANLDGVDFFRAIAKGLKTPKKKVSKTGLRVWLMNEQTHDDIRVKTLALNASAAIVSGVNERMPVFSGDIIELDFIPEYDIIGGYLDVYMLVEREGANIRTSVHCKFIQDQTVMIGEARYDGKPIYGEAFVAFNYNNTKPTTVMTFAGDKANAKRVSLSSLSVGTADLFPAFDPNTLNYTTTVSAHSNAITVKTVEEGAAVSIKNGNTAVTNGKNATFTNGNNLLTITVSNGNAEPRVYTVTVKDETASS